MLLDLLWRAPKVLFVRVIRCEVPQQWLNAVNRAFFPPDSTSLITGLKLLLSPTSNTRVGRTVSLGSQRWCWLHLLIQLWRKQNVDMSDGLQCLRKPGTYLTGESTRCQHRYIILAAKTNLFFSGASSVFPCGGRRPPKSHPGQSHRGYCLRRLQSKVTCQCEHPTQ